MAKVEEEACPTLLDIVGTSKRDDGTFIVSADQALAVKDIIMRLRDFTEASEYRVCLNQIDQIMYHVVFTLYVHQDRVHHLNKCVTQLHDSRLDYFQRDVAMNWMKVVLAKQGRRFHPGSPSEDPRDFSGLVPVIEATDRIHTGKDGEDFIREPPIMLNAKYIVRLKSKVQHLQSSISPLLKLKECIASLANFLEYTANMLQKYESMIEGMQETMSDGSMTREQRLSNISNILSELPIFEEGKARMMFITYTIDTSGAQLTSAASTSRFPPIRAPVSRYRIEFTL